MLFPDYNGGSLVNLMSTIGNHFGINMKYPSLRDFPPNFLDRTHEGKTDSSPVVLIVIDGLGYNYLLKQDKNSNFRRYLRGSMTSVFPSTTAAAMTSYYSGVAPLNHGVPAWFTYLREMGVVSTILLMNIRGFRTPLLYNDLVATDIFDFPSFAAKLPCASASLFPKPIFRTPYSSYAVRKSRELKYRSKNIKNFFKTMLKTLTSKNSPAYLLSYWPDFDSHSHIYGIHSEKTQQQFEALDFEFGRFVDKVKEKVPAVRIILTADHGLVDTPDDRTLWLHDYPELRSMLTLPIVGEGRVPFLYVRPRTISAFEQYMNRHFSDFGELWPLDRALKEGIFGLYEPHPRFIERVGDYLLFMKDNYVFRERLLGESKEKMIGNHGGWSKDEMEIPLILVD
ncbi:MAG: alkaline phosphatase family protein [Promethearchaeota archaeon]